MTLEWDFVAGADLDNAYVGQSSLSDLVPNCSAIYLWRRAFRVPRPALRSGDAFLAWLDTAMQAPTAEVHDRRLSHFAVVDQLTIRGSGITQTKREQFGDLIARPKAREWLATYIRAASAFSPPLYCGETTHLAQRTREHLSGETGFGQRIQQQNVDAPWADLELAFCRLDSVRLKDEARAAQLRKLLEIITTAFSLAGYVSRRG